METTVRNWLKRATFLAVGCVGLMPLTAQAHEHVDIVIRGEPICRPEVRTTQVWVEPVYRTVCDDIIVPERCEATERVFYEHGRRVVRVERVVIPAHTERVERREMVFAGHYETQVVRVMTPYHSHERVSFGVAFHS